MVVLAYFVIALLFWPKISATAVRLVTDGLSAPDTFDRTMGCFIGLLAACFWPFMVLGWFGAKGLADGHRWFQAAQMPESRDEKMKRLERRIADLERETGVTQ